MFDLIIHRLNLYVSALVITGCLLFSGISNAIETIAREDDYFIERKLYPNIDFYSGITLKAIGIPTELFTVIFTLGRMPGWISHWNEMLSAPYKIARPRQLYLGEHQREYVDINNR